MNQKVQLEEVQSQFQRCRNVGRNVVYGLLSRCVSLLLPFIVRTVLIYRFGALYRKRKAIFKSEKAISDVKSNIRQFGIFRFG